MLTSRSSKLLKAFDSLVTKPLIGSHGLVIALTETEKLDLIAWNRDLENNLVVVGNPPLANLEDNAPIRSGKNVLFVARLHKRKAPIDFASAAEFSSRSGWDEVYDMLGPDEGELESVLKKTRDLDNFQYLGATDLRGVVRAVAECGVFVLCSRNGPWGNVLATALEFGKPVAVTQSSALASLVEKYDAGIIVDEGSPEQIAGAVHSMLEVDKYKSYSANARKLAELEFGLAATKNKLEHIYRLAIGRRVEH
jgi:glycosyltransferase involved in cell wall biosynthesis